jgi:hypothetical protein
LAALDFTAPIQPVVLPPSANPILREAAQEIIDIGLTWERNGDSAYHKAEVLQRRSVWLTFLAAALAGISGLIALALPSRTVTVTMALAAALISAYLGTVRPGQDAAEEKATAFRHWEISREVRGLRLRLPSMSPDEAVESLDKLSARAHEIAERGPVARRSDI